LQVRQKELIVKISGAHDATLYAATETYGSRSGVAHDAERRQVLPHYYTRRCMQIFGPPALAHSRQPRPMPRSPKI
jgi:hypothetical protein